MSTPIATVANALIEFILSLLRDPAAREEFDADPDAALANAGLANVSATDVCAVAPVIYHRPDVQPAPAPAPAPSYSGGDGGGGGGGWSNRYEPPAVQEVKNILHQMTHVTNNNTVIDQSVNQNIWAKGDVMQVFDQSAVVATGEGAMAAGKDLSLDKSTDNSTTITATDDSAILIDNAIDVEVTEDSYNDVTIAPDNSTTTDVDVEGSFNETEAVAIDTDESFNETGAVATDDAYNETGAVATDDAYSEPEVVAIDTDDSFNDATSYESETDFTVPELDVVDEGVQL